MVSRWLSALAAFLVGTTLCTAAARAADYPSAPAAGVPPSETAIGYLVITAPEAEVLADPRSGAASLLKVVKGDLLPLRGQVGDWYAVAAGEAAGWVHRDAAALLVYPEFLDPARLREAYTPPPYVPPGARYYPGYYGGYGGYPRVPWPWQDPLWWGLWWYDREHDDDDDDHHHDRDDDDDDDRRRRDRRRDPRPSGPLPPPPADPRMR